MKKQFAFIIIILLSIYSCSEHKDALEKEEFDIEMVKPIIEKNSKLWNKGLMTKDISVFLNLYDEGGHYLPDADKAIHGNAAIAEYWKNSWDFVKELHLNMETLEGTEDLLYETGKGSILIMNDTGEYDEFKFKYVNVWKKQDDGSYKVVIDTFNELKND